MNASPDIKDLAAALSAAQGEIEGALKGSVNPAFRGSKYADLQSVFEALRQPFAKHGIAIMQSLHNTEGGIACETVLMHSTGQWISTSSPTFPLDKPNCHGVGSASTYARRFSLVAAAGISSVDDDGNSVSLPAKPEPEASPWTIGVYADAQAAGDNYAAWWSKQSNAFRQAAIGTKEHAEFKAKVAA